MWKLSDGGSNMHEGANTGGRFGVTLHVERQEI